MGHDASNLVVVLLPHKDLQLLVEIRKQQNRVIFVELSRSIAKCAHQHILHLAEVSCKPNGVHPLWKQK
ncbi:hypothetical protein X975_07044, partial [Stegodyphus mimosarum]